MGKVHPSAHNVVVVEGRVDCDWWWFVKRRDEGKRVARVRQYQEVLTVDAITYYIPNLSAPTR